MTQEAGQLENGFRPLSILEIIRYNRKKGYKLERKRKEKWSQQ